MGIDRIGPKGSPAPSPTGPVRESPTSTEAPSPFEVRRPAAAEAAAQTRPPSAAVGPSPLDRLRRGEVDLNGYLNAKVDEATEHLAALPAEELDALRRSLRDRLASDPTLVELVRTATGMSPEPVSDD